MYNQSTWDNLDNLSRFATFGFKFAFIFESIANAFLLSFSILIIFAFFNRRKSLPYFFIAFKISSFIILLLDLSLTFWVDGGSTGHGYISDITRLIIQGFFATIWILYFLKSERVKATFVFTYPKHLWNMALIQDLSKNFQSNHIPNNTSNFDHQHRIEENERF